jgi:predicted O-methyltransferase YrrM
MAYVGSRIRQMLFQRMHPGLPWLTRDAIRLLEAWLRPHHRGLELGSGRSTFWFAERVEGLVSVEHDPEWHARVTMGLAERGLGNVDLILAGAERECAEAIRRQADSSFDFILIDGLYREASLAEGLRKLKPSGMLILDNAERYLLPPNDRIRMAPHQRKTSNDPVWSEFQQSEGARHALWTNDGVDCTAFYFPRMGETVIGSRIGDFIPYETRQAS